MPADETFSAATARVNAKTASDGTLRVVATEDYDRLKGPGIAAPFPGDECAALYPWGTDSRMFYRESDDAEWVELEPLADGGTFPLPVGSSVRIDSPPHIGLVMW